MSAGITEYPQRSSSQEASMANEKGDLSEAVLSSIDVLRDKLESAEMRANDVVGKKASPWEAKLVETYIAMTAVVNFCVDNDVNVRPLAQLMEDLGNVALGRHPSEMLTYRGGSGRPSDRLFVEYLKGAVAATAVYCQGQGQSLKAASVTVSRALPDSIRDYLRSPNRPDTPTPKTIEEWVARYQSPQSSYVNGHRGYQMMADRLSTMAPAVAGLKRFIEDALIAFVVPAKRVPDSEDSDEKPSA